MTIHVRYGMEQMTGAGLLGQEGVIVADASPEIAGTLFAPYRATCTAVLAAVNSDEGSGLDTADASSRLQRYGPNQLPVVPPEPVWRRFLAQFQDPLTVLLLVATVISFVSWIVAQDTVLPYDAIVILAIVFFNGALGFLQEQHAEQAVAALKAMVSQTARVLRDGVLRGVPAADIVPGDVVVIEEGDTVPADGRVLEAMALRMSEATLTGESTSVPKDTAPLCQEAGIADQMNMVFSGTAVAAGRGRVIVTATGADSEVGKIATSLQRAVEDPTPLQRELDRVGKTLGIGVVGIALLVGATILVTEPVHTFADLVEVLLLAVALAVAAVPEGLTAITTIVLSLGMQRMAQRNVIVRKLAAVETLGSTTDICSDKTGTLTQNQMTVRAVVTASGGVELTGSGYAPEGQVLMNGQSLTDDRHLDEVSEVLLAAGLACNATLERDGDRWFVQGDSTEGALLVAARKLGIIFDHVHTRYQRIAEIPFSSERKRMSTVHRVAGDNTVSAVFSKGAPDVLLAACNHEWVRGEERPLTSERREAILTEVEALAGQALRTLGVARRIVPRQAFERDSPDRLEEALVWLGMVGMIDPPRPEARESVRLAKQAGIRTVMITGDHARTAQAIAEELGISSAGTNAVSGPELNVMGDAVLGRVVCETVVFARVEPSHKLRIIRALKANNRIVAMTGDGVNDAPALKTADIGVAMGMTGTDVSKGAADMILIDDNFASIVAAVEEGRAIFANIQKFLWFLLSSNLGEVLAIFLGVVLAGWIGLVAEPGSSVVVPLIAVQILWVNLLTDAAPALALGLEPAEPNQMHRPPRDPSHPVIDGRMWRDIGLIGLVMAVGTLFVIDAALPGGLVPGSGSLAYAQTMAFTVLVFFQLFNVFNARSDQRSAFHNLGGNRWVWVAVLLSALLQVAVVYVPFLQQAFGTVPLNGRDWLICIGVSSTVLWIDEGVKYLRQCLRSPRLRRSPDIGTM